MRNRRGKELLANEKILNNMHMGKDLWLRIFHVLQRQEDTVIFLKKPSSFLLKSALIDQVT